MSETLLQAYVAVTVMAQLCDHQVIWKRLHDDAYLQVNLTEDNVALGVILKIPLDALQVAIMMEQLYAWVVVI